MEGQKHMMSSSSEATGFRQRSLSCDPVDHDIQMFSLSAAGSILSVSPQNHEKNDGSRIDHGLSSLLAAHAGSAPIFGDQQIEQNGSGNVDTRGKSVVECTSNNSIKVAVGGTSPSLLKSTESFIKSCQLAGSSSGNLEDSGSHIEGRNGESSSLVCVPGSSLKIKVNGSTSGSGVSFHESSISHLPVENNVIVNMPSQANAVHGLRVSAQHVSSPFLGSPAEQNPINWHGIVTSSDLFPRTETNLDPFSSSDDQQTYPAHTMTSTLNAPLHFNFAHHQPYMVQPFYESLGWGSSSTMVVDVNYPQNVHGPVPVPGFLANLPPFFSSGNYNMWGDDFFCTPNGSGVGGNPSGEVGVRGTWGTATAPFLHAMEPGNLPLDPRSWDTPGNVNFLVPSAGAPGFPILSGPMIPPHPAFSWMAYETEAALQSLHGLPGFAPIFYQPDALEFAFYDFSYLLHAPPHALYWDGMPYGPSIEVPNHYAPGAGIPEDEGYSDYDFQLTFQAIEAEGRGHLLSEVELFLNDMRRLCRWFSRLEDLLNRPMMVPWSFLVDLDGDVLDVDDMTYEELLDLEDQMGNVTTGFSDETILEGMQRQTYAPCHEGTSSDTGLCPICREMFAFGEDVGELKCGHDFHTGCIKEWLKLKNSCPICKAVAINP